MKVISKGRVKLRKHIRGKNNKIIIDRGAVLNNTFFRIVGNDNVIKFEDNVIVGPNCSFWMEGDNITINIGCKSTFTRACHINAQESDMSIIIGEDCMFSNYIIVRTSDSHPIYDLVSGKRINKPHSVYIGNHVWIAPKSTIMKGVSIGNNTIIGSNTIVTKSIPANSLAVGQPARVVKNNIRWSRENIF